MDIRRGEYQSDACNGKFGRRAIKTRGCPILIFPRCDFLITVDGRAAALDADLRVSPLDRARPRF